MLVDRLGVRGSEWAFVISASFRGAEVPSVTPTEPPSGLQCSAEGLTGLPGAAAAAATLGAPRDNRANQERSLLGVTDGAGELRSLLLNCRPSKASEERRAK